MLNQYLMPFFRMLSLGYKFVEQKKVLYFSPQGYYPFQIMEIGDYFFIDKSNMRAVNIEIAKINSVLNKNFVAKSQDDSIKITRIN
jgi:hypothetical protein